MTPRQLKTLRMKLGLSQEQLAKELGVSTSTLSHWEQGVQKISPVAVRLLKILRQNTT